MGILRANSAIAYKNQLYELIKEEFSSNRQAYTDPCFEISPEIIGNLNVSGDIEWKRPEELCEFPKLFYNYEHEKIVRPGELSANTTLAGCALLLGHKELRSLVIPNVSDQEWDFARHASQGGVFHFRFWRHHCWVDVVVDDRLPTCGGTLLGMQGEMEHEFWAALIEKAYAKLHGSYDALHNIHMADIMEDFTGGITTCVNINVNHFSETDYGNFFDFLFEENKHCSFLTFTKRVDEDTQDVNLIERSQMRSELGIKKTHVYCLKDIKKVNLVSGGIQNLFRDRQRIALIRFCDPIRKGNRPVIFESIQQHIEHVNSTDEEEYAYSSSSLVRMHSRNTNWTRLGQNERENLGLGVADETEFWMALEDVVNEFSQVYVIRTFNLFKDAPEKWHYYTTLGEWSVGVEGSSTDRSGGIFEYNMFRSPQYLIKVKKDQNFVAQLTQCPEFYVSQFEHIGFTILKVEENRKTRLHKMLLHFTTVMANSLEGRRSVSYKGHLKKGCYVLIPTVLRPHCNLRFVLRLYTSYTTTFKELLLDYPKMPLYRLACISRAPKLGTIITIIELKPVNYQLENKRPYCKLISEHEEVKTTTVPGENPKWGQTFIFYRLKKDKPITIKVYSHNRVFPDSLLGKMTVPITASFASDTVEFEDTILNTDKRRYGVFDCILHISIINETQLMSL